MTVLTSQYDLLVVREFVLRHLGLSFPDDRIADLERGIAASAQAAGRNDQPTYIDWLLAPPVTEEKISSLARLLTVGETYFYRESDYFTALQYEILPRIIEARKNTTRHLRIWSAGCCTGEEAYTLAILVRRLIPDLSDWRIEMYGTDINPQFLSKARSGVYGAWSFRATPSWFQHGYFKRQDDGAFAVDTTIRDMVKFFRLNLVESDYPEPFVEGVDFDIIFCRNVLMYFSDEVRSAVVERLVARLRPGGWFQVSATELVPFCERTLEQVPIGDIYFYRKLSACSPQKSEAVRDRAPRVNENDGRADARHAVLAAGTPVRRRRTRTVRRNAASDTKMAAVPGALPSQHSSDESVRQARRLADAGTLEEALRAINSALDCDTLTPTGHFLKAGILHGLGRVSDAVEALQKALFLDPTFLMARFMLAGFLREHGRENQARKHFAQTRKLAAKLPAGEFPLESDGLNAGQIGAMAEVLEHGS